MVGQHVDPNWADFDKGPISLKERLQRIYCLKQKTLDFGQGIWQEVLTFFKTRVELVHPSFISKTEVRDSEIPTVFERVGQKYPLSKIIKISEGAIDTLLADTSLQRLKNTWQQQGYAGPPRH